MLHDVNHIIRTESREAEFNFEFHRVSSNNDKVFKDTKTFKNVNSKLNYCFLKLQFYVTAYLLHPKLSIFVPLFYELLCRIVATQASMIVA